MLVRCHSLYSTDSFSSLELSHLAPVLAADGPGSSHPPSSSSGMVPPLSWTTPFLSQGSIWPIFLATPWTAVGDPACPQPAPCSSPYPLALAFTWPFPLHTILGTGQEHSLLQGIPSFLPNAFTLSCQLDFSRKTEYRDVQQETLVERDWVWGSREGALGTLKCGVVKG